MIFGIKFNAVEKDPRWFDTALIRLSMIANMVHHSVNKNNSETPFIDDEVILVAISEGQKRTLNDRLLTLKHDCP